MRASNCLYRWDHVVASTAHIRVQQISEYCNLNGKDRARVKSENKYERVHAPVPLTSSQTPTGPHRNSNREHGIDGCKKARERCLCANNITTAAPWLLGHKTLVLPLIAFSAFRARACVCMRAASVCLSDFDSACRMFGNAIDQWSSETELQSEIHHEMVFHI